MPETPERAAQRSLRLRRRTAAGLFAVGLIGSIMLIIALAAAQPTCPAGASAPLGEAIAEAAAGERFTLARWELESAFNRWLGIAARLLYSEPACDAAAELERLAEGSAAIDGQAAQCVERALERAVAAAISENGLAEPLPLFRSQSIVWPPVDIELRRAPRVLAVSPRAEIRLIGSVLLSPDLPRSEYGRIEAALEAGGEWSAWIGGVGGVATYPAIVIPRSNWYDALRLTAHEWIHHYLIFHPLGRAYFASDALRTINETVADIAGNELAARAAGFAALDRPTVESGESGRAEHPAAALAGLRLDVEALLAEGRLAEAEALMEAARLELAAAGLRYRRINQAFFAFRGGYATQPGATSPYGPLLEQLRARSTSLAHFVAVIRTVNSRAAADALLGRP